MTSPTRFFLSATTTTDNYTLSLHDALPIYRDAERRPRVRARPRGDRPAGPSGTVAHMRPGEIVVDREDAQDRKSTRLELQSRVEFVCGLLFEKKTGL